MVTRKDSFRVFSFSLFTLVTENDNMFTWLERFMFFERVGRMKVYEKLFELFVAQDNCKASKNDWYWRHNEHIENIVKNYLPSGSGFDSGCRMEIESCSPGIRKGDTERLVFKTDFHVMDENGFYDGWEEYYIVVTPSFRGITIEVSGSNRNGLRDYINDVFYDSLDREYISQYA